MNKIARIITKSRKDKKIIGAQIRVKKNGRFASVNGKVKEIGVNRDGEVYFLMENFLGKKRKDGRKWQNVRLANVIKVFRDGKVYE
jgi:hypothetical protein